MKFIGVDLGWSSGASGLCCLVWHDNGLKILDLTTVLAIDEIIAWSDRWISTNVPGIIAVDAPTIINNQTGMRLADRLTHKYFGRYHAGCYPANLGLKFADRTTGFAQSLKKIIKYKRGKIADRRNELKRLRGYITEILPQLEPALNPASLEKIPPIAEKQTGKELKAIETQPLLLVDTKESHYLQNEELTKLGFAY